MKKYFIASLGLLIFGLQSCNKEKNQPADQLQTTEQSVVAHEDHTNDELIKTAQAKPLTNLVLSEAMFDFGDIKKGESKSHTYEVTNTGTNPLIISAVKPGCGCTAPDYSKEPILPGQKGFITLKFDSTNFDGSIQKQAEVFANVEKAPIIIGFTGNIK